MVRESTDTELGLVTNRAIDIRVFLTSTEEGVAPPPLRLRVRSSRGVLLHEERRVHDKPIGKTFDIGSFKDSMRFKLQAAWVQPGFRIELQIEDDERGGDVVPGNNFWSFAPQMYKARILYLTVMPVHMQSGDAGEEADEEDPPPLPEDEEPLSASVVATQARSDTRPPIAKLPNEDPNDPDKTATRAILKSTLMAAFPISDVRIRFYDKHDSKLSGPKGNWRKLLTELGALRTSDLSVKDKKQGFYVGFVNVNGGLTRGISVSPGHVALIQSPLPDASATNWMGTLRHELGHNLFRKHKDCVLNDPTGQKWGYDAMNDRLIDPRVTRDTMATACAKWPGWWSHEEYRLVEKRVRTYGLHEPETGLHEWK